MEYLLTSTARRISGAYMRFSLAVILAWIGALKFVDPSPVVGLLQASLPFLAFSTFVYLVGAVEIVVAILLASGIAQAYAGLVTVGLLAGQFLLKDLGLMAAAVSVIGMTPVREPRRAAAQAVMA